MSIRIAAVALLLGVRAIGCAPVPDIRFVPDEDAALDGSSSADATTDAAAPPADAADAADAARCPSTAPVGDVCCGTIWCVGDCTAAACSDCEQRVARAMMCVESDVCCAKNGNVACKSKCP